MTDALAKRDVSVHITKPFKRNGEWYGAVVLNINGQQVRLMASVPEPLVRSVKALAAKHIRLERDGLTISSLPLAGGCQGCGALADDVPSIPSLPAPITEAPPIPAHPPTFVDKLVGIAPYLPREGLAPEASQAADLIVRASQGCEACVDRLLEIQERAKQGDQEAIAAKGVINAVIQLGLVRLKAVESVARMSPEQFHAFIQRLQKP